MGGLIVAGEIKTPNLIDMLVFVYGSLKHDWNYKYSLNVQPRTTSGFRKLNKFNKTIIPNALVGYDIIYSVSHKYFYDVIILNSEFLNTVVHLLWTASLVW